MPDDPEPADPLAELDQALAALVTRAKIVRVYFIGLLAEGFDAEQAFTLTRDYAEKWTI